MDRLKELMDGGYADRRAKGEQLIAELSPAEINGLEVSGRFVASPDNPELHFRLTRGDAHVWVICEVAAGTVYVGSRGYPLESVQQLQDVLAEAASSI